MERVPGNSKKVPSVHQERVNGSLTELVTISKMQPPCKDLQLNLPYLTKPIYGNLVPRGCIPFGQHQGCKTSGIINVKMLTDRNLIGC